MFAHNGWRLVGGMCCVAFCAAALPASAQVTLRDVEAEADRLHDRAMAMASGTSRLADLPAIAELHGQAAKLRHWKDPDAFACLKLQGGLLAAVGKPDEARFHFEEAAGVALANGDVTSAANALLDAAFAAEAQGRHADAQALARKGYRLSQSEEVSAKDRSSIQQRIYFRQVQFP